MGHLKRFFFFEIVTLRNFTSNTHFTNILCFVIMELEKFQQMLKFTVLDIIVKVLPIAVIHKSQYKYKMVVKTS